jgi:hypothetical protein
MTSPGETDTTDSGERTRLTLERIPQLVEHGRVDHFDGKESDEGGPPADAPDQCKAFDRVDPAWRQPPPLVDAEMTR